MHRLPLPILITCVVAALQAQDSPVVGAGAGRVRVDMYATVDGRSVEDLTADEVEILEDGVPQTVDTFAHVTMLPTGSRPAAAARAFVVFVDTHHTQIEGSSPSQLGLVRLLDRLIGPTDLVALMTPDLPPADIVFAPKGRALSDIMQAEWTWGRRGRLVDGLDAKEALYETCYGSERTGDRSTAEEMRARRRERLTLDALADLTVHVGGMREGRTALVVVSEGWELVAPSAALSESGRRREQPRDGLRPARGRSGGATPSGVTRIECESDRAALATLDHTQRLRQIAEDANGSNVSFYPVSAAGPGPIDASSREDPRARVRRDSLTFLAAETDGTAILAVADVDDGLARIIEDLSSYYLLGYVSTNTKLDGRFRNVRVRVSRPDVRVRARRGYRGKTADELLSRASSANRAGEEEPPTPASDTGQPAFRIRTSSWTREIGGTPSGAFWIVGELDYRTRRELAWTAGAAVDIVVLAADGTEVMTHMRDVRTADGAFGLEVPASGGLPPGEYAVRVRLTSEADEAAVLSDTGRVILVRGAGLGEPVLWRRGPSTGLTHQLTANPRFQRNERLRLEFPTAGTGPVETRLLDRVGNPLSVPMQVHERADASGAFGWVVVDVSLAPFAPGDYSIEVIQGDARRVTGFRIVP